MPELCIGNMVPGPRGRDGTDGVVGVDGLNAYTVTDASFVMPAVADTVVVTVVENGWAFAGQTIFVEDAGYFTVVSKAGTTSLTLRNRGDTGNAAPATVISAANGVSPGGVPGVDGTLTGAAGGDLTGTYPNPTIGLLKVTSAKMSVTGVTAGFYGSSSQIPILGIDVAGRITSAVNASFTAAPTGPAGGDLTGTYPNPTLLVVVPTKGGTGQSTVTTGDLLYGSAANVWSKLPSAALGNVLRAKGVGVAPAWEPVNLQTDVTSVLGATNGGTGTTVVVTGDLLYGSAPNTWSRLPSSVAGNVLISGGIGVAPAWGPVVTSSTGVSPGTANQILSTNLAATASEWRTLAGTSNQIAVAFLAGNVTLSTPQNIHTGASPTFIGLTLTGLTQGTPITGAGGALAQDTTPAGHRLYGWNNTALDMRFITMGTGLSYDPATDILTSTGAGVTSITLTQPAAGFTITGSGVAITSTGTPTFALADDLAAVEALATTGWVQRTALNTWSTSTLIPLSGGGTGSALSDPGGHRIMGWDDTNGDVRWFIIGANLSYDDATDTLNAAGSGGGGTVTSVGLSAPAEFSVTGSPVTISGTLALAWATQTANKVFASAVSGGAATPAFRALVNDDLPSGIDAAKIGGGLVSTTEYDFLANVTSDIQTQLNAKGTVSSVAATAPAAGFTISGSPITTTGTFVFALADDLAAIEALTTSGVAQRTGTSTWATALGTASRIVSWSATAPYLTSVANLGTFIAGTAGQITVTDDLDGTITLSLAGAGTAVTGTGTINKLPKWTAATILGDSLVSESGVIVTTTGTTYITGNTAGACVVGFPTGVASSDWRIVHSTGTFLSTADPLMAIGYNPAFAGGFGCQNLADSAVYYALEGCYRVDLGNGLGAVDYMEAYTEFVATGGATSVRAIMANVLKTNPKTWTDVSIGIAGTGSQFRVIDYTGAGSTILAVFKNEPSMLLNGYFGVGATPSTSYRINSEETVAGTSATWRLGHTATSGASHAKLLLQTGAGGGDPFINLVGGASEWSLGLDNSVSGDPFVLSASGALGTANAFSVTFNGDGTLLRSLTLGGAPLTGQFLISAPSGTANSDWLLGHTTGTFLTVADPLMALGYNVSFPTGGFGRVNLFDSAVYNAWEATYQVDLGNGLGAVPYQEAYTEFVGIDGNSVRGINSLSLKSAPKTFTDVSIGIAGAGSSFRVIDYTGAGATLFSVVKNIPGVYVPGYVGINISPTSSYRLNIDESVAGTSASARIGHTATSGASHAKLLMQTASGGGDPFINFVSGAVEFSMGVDNSASDVFKISASGALGTTDWFTLTAAGAVTFAGSVEVTGALTKGGVAVSLVGHTHAATDIVSGTMATARLGSGTADGTTFLRGDSTWANPLPQAIATTDSPTFVGLKLSGLTALRWVLTDALKNLFTPASTAYAIAGYDGSGSGAVHVTLAGTTNQVNISDGAATGDRTVTFSLPQSIHTGASPTFAGLTLTSPLSVANGGTGVATLADAGVLIGNGTGAVQVTSAGTAGQVLTSNGAGVDPTFQALGGGTLTIGDPIALGVAGRVLFEDNSNDLGQSAGLVWDTTLERLVLTSAYLHVTTSTGTGNANGVDININRTGTNHIGIYSNVLGATNNFSIHLENGDMKLGNGTSKLGFFAATPVVKPTVTGSRGGNAALASLLTALSNFGLLTDSSS